MAEHLEGFSSFYSHARQIDLNNSLSVFYDGEKAGFIVGSASGLGPRQTIAYSDGPWKTRIKNLVDVLHETAGFPYVGDVLECDLCGGSGIWIDADGDTMVCPECGLDSNHRQEQR